MATLTINVEDNLARHIEESARREHVSVSEWIEARIKSAANRAATLAAMEARAVANGYPREWLTLFGSLGDDETFASPLRSGSRSVPPLDGD